LLGSKVYNNSKVCV